MCAYGQTFFLLCLALLCCMSGNAENLYDKMRGPAVAQKAEAWLSQMTLDEKIGQMTQVDITALRDPQHITTYYLGSLLAGGDSEAPDIQPQGWLKLYQEYQKFALQTRLKIPLIFGIDAVHGHNNVQGAVVFPHNIGLGATHNPALVQEAGKIISQEIAGTGMNWTFAPCLAVVQDERWGRSYESFGEMPDLVSSLGKAFVQGLQMPESKRPITIACAKHYMGDGGTTQGQDQGNTECDEPTLRKLHLPGYIATIEAGVGTVMISYSSWNGKKMHSHHQLITEVLKGELKFPGFVVSDWAGIDQLPGDYKSDIQESILAGLDMVMIPNGPGLVNPDGSVSLNNNYVEFITYLKELVQEGKVPIARIDDAVRRILLVKIASGLVEYPYGNPDCIQQIGQASHRAVARECVRQSLVLLQNRGQILPISKELSRIHVAGKSADDLGNQCGGWTISWQGASGQAISGGTTILQGIRQTVASTTQVTYTKDGVGVNGADIAIAVIGEPPYAEMFGDAKDLSLALDDITVIQNLKQAGIPIIAVFIGGRPRLIQDILPDCNAFVVAWLPGTEGQGVSDVLFGNAPFVGKLPISWPKAMSQLPLQPGQSTYEPLFPYGFGLK